MFGGPGARVGRPGPQTGRLWDLDLNFIGGSFDERIAYSGGGGNLSHFDSAGLLKFVANNVPASNENGDHDPITLAPLGFSLWEPRTNIQRNSDDPRSAVLGYSDGGSTETEDASTIFGISVPRQQRVAGGAFSGITAIGRATISGSTAGNVYTASIYVENNSGRSTATFRISEEGGAQATASTDLAVTLPSTAGRLTVTHTVVENDRTAISIQLQSDAAGTYDIFTGLWQIELGAFPTPYIKTTTAAVTRTATVATMSDLSWFDANQGTLFAEFSLPTAIVSGDFPEVFAISDGDFSDVIAVGDLASTPVTQGRIRASNTNSVILGKTTQSAGTNEKAILSWSATDDAASFTTQGAAVGTDSDITIPVGLDTVTIGRKPASDFLNGHIATIQYKGLRRPNEFLQDITA